MDSSVTNQSWKHDVYLNYRGADTGTNFADHLYSSLHQRGISTFQDDEVKRGGDEIAPTLLRAIEESRIAITIISENYASSSWCLDELVKILECRRSLGQIVRPVFYHVDPSDVRKQRGRFGEAFAVHEARHRNIERIMKWREALFEVANLSGWVLRERDRESKFINNIGEEISLQELNRTYLHVAKNPIGIESRVHDVNELLGAGVDDVRMVGIWGIEGIGKTTVAKAVYNSIAHRFEGSCFLYDVREKNSMANNLAMIKLQKTLLYETLGGRKLNITSVDKGINVIKQRLRHRKVLLILDNVDQLEQLDQLVGGSNWFGMGSRIIITTRSLNLLTAHNVDIVYEVPKLDPDEAFELFSCSASPGGNRLTDDYAQIALRLVHYAKGIPSVITVMGSLLFGRRIDELEAVLRSYTQVHPRTTLDVHEIIEITKSALEHPVVVPEAETAPLIPKAETAPPKSEERYVQMHELHGEMLYKIVPQEGKKVFTVEWIFLLTGLVLEVLSIFCDQSSSPSKPHYAVIGMCLAIVASITCILDLIYKAKNESATFRRRGVLFWYYYPPPCCMPFGTFKDIFGLISGLSLCASSTVQCVCVLWKIDNPFKVSLLPIIFLICSGGSILFKNRRWTSTDETELRLIAVTKT